jgi:hypothetical protein
MQERVQPVQVQEPVQEPVLEQVQSWRILLP